MNPLKVGEQAALTPTARQNVRGIYSFRLDRWMSVVVHCDSKLLTINGNEFTCFTHLTKLTKLTELTCGSNVCVTIENNYLINYSLNEQLNRSQ